MKSLSPALQAHLDDGTTTLAWCWRITRADGVTFGFTDHDRTLSFDGTEFEPESGLTASEAFRGKSRVQQHKMVYDALQGKMGGVLHALALQTSAPD